MYKFNYFIGDFSGKNEKGPELHQLKIVVFSALGIVGEIVANICVGHLRFGLSDRRKEWE